jgi:hypothetical protein
LAPCSLKRSRSGLFGSGSAANAGATRAASPTRRFEVHFAKTHDRIGPLGAKSMSESPFNPVAAALVNAIHDAAKAVERQVASFYLTPRSSALKGQGRSAIPISAERPVPAPAVARSRVSWRQPQRGQ